MLTVVLLIVLGTSIWVYLDAGSLIAHEQLRPGVLNNGAGWWLLGCLALWIVVFPMYLVARPKYVEARRCWEQSAEPNE